MYKHEVVQQSHGTEQRCNGSPRLTIAEWRDEQVPHSITPSGDGGCVMPFSVLRDWVYVRYWCCQKNEH